MNSNLTIVPETVERINADEALAHSAGFSPKPPIYAVGTPVNEVGVKNFRASRLAFEDLPLAVPALEAFRDSVRAEGRHNVAVTYGDLSLRADGILESLAGLLPISEPAFERLAYAVAPNSGRYLVNCPPWLRAQNFNYWVTRDHVAKRPLQLRIRTIGGQDEVFAAVGPRYADHDVNVIAEQLLQAAEPGTRAEIKYDGFRAKFSLLHHTNIKPEQAAAGEFFKAGSIIRTDDTGRGSVRCDAEMWRNLCLNLIIIDRSKVKVGRRAHIGKITISDDVLAGVEASIAAVAGFGEKWGEASLENVFERYEVEGVEAIFRGLVYNKVVWTVGVGSEGLVERLQRAWDQEPGYSKAAIVNAVSRAAHEEPWCTPWATDDLEAQAGELLYAKVWNVQLPEEVS